QAEPGPDGPLGIVFVRDGVAKIHQYPIPKVLGQVAVKALNPLCTGLVIGLHHLPEVFRVQAPRQRGRVDQVTEQYSEGAAFSLRGRQNAWRERHILTGERSQCVRQRGGWRIRRLSRGWLEGYGRRRPGGA